MIKDEQNDSNTYIILLNYNGWEDTNLCLDSLLEMDTNNFKIVICDNLSTNNSVNKIYEKIQQLNINHGVTYAYYKNDSVSKRLIYQEGSRQGFNKITLIENNENKGFSAGNNIGIRFSLSDKNCQYIWLLNNDTQVHPHALSALLDIFSQNEKIMMSSSVCCEFNERDKIQYIGGHIDPWTCRTRAIGHGILYQDIDKVDLSDLSLLAGPSVMIRTKYFHEAKTYLDERYSFYFEEADLAKSILKMGYEIAPCLDSIIYHRGGHSTSKVGQTFTTYHYTRSKFLFALKFYPKRILFVSILTLAKILLSCCTGKFFIAVAAIKGWLAAINFRNS